MTARPIYETGPATHAEAEIADTLAAQWRAAFMRCPRFSRVDWLVHRDGALVAVVEIKARTHPPTQYPTLLLSAHKWVTVRAVAHDLSVYGLLVVRFGDGTIRVADLDRVAVADCGFGGRTDRGDPHDVEPCVYLPVDQMVAP